MSLDDDNRASSPLADPVATTDAPATAPAGFDPPTPERDDHRFEMSEAVEWLLDADGSAVLIASLDGELRTVNSAGLTLLGAERADDLRAGTAPYALMRSFLDHAPQSLFDDPEGGTWHGDFDDTTPTGEHRILRATVTVRHDPSMTGGGFAAVMAHDVTEAREEAARLRHRATHDPLTGLSNRRQIMNVLADAVRDQRGRSGHVATFFVDLDRLKYVNDALGHDIGDRLLVSSARRLTEVVRPNDRVARIGGDEFLVVCSGMPDAITALDLAERIRRALSGRLRIRDLDIEFGVSIGIALSDSELLAMAEADAASTLISNADTAMYEAKHTGRGRCLLFTDQMRSTARERTELAAALAHAIKEEAIEVEYQPVFSAVTQTAIGAEALVRWIHPTRGRIDTGTFISVAEESGSIVRLGELVVARAMRDARIWLDQQLVDSDFAVHINVSKVQLANPAFVSFVLAQLRHHRLRPEQLVLEAREQALLNRDLNVERSVRALRRLGVKIAVDNFGTGANALSILTDVGADILKLDGALALPSGSSDSDTRLVRALVLLAHALDMQVIAERVSGMEQLRRLRAAGCDFAQGNLLGEPTPADQFVASTAY
ncbi:MAG: putative bifunctional diguanylate cyclase/phosphodiesterase [Ilumatobacteraceae bacterium]